MKTVHFEVLDFEAKVPDEYSYTDMGHTQNLMDTAKSLVNDVMKFPVSRESDLEMFGFCMPVLLGNHGGVYFCANNEDKMDSFIFYNPFSYDVEMHVRAHEEVHAAVDLGLRKDLEKLLGMPDLGVLSLEDFCDQVGLYVLRRKGIDFPAKLSPSEREKMLIAAKLP